MRLRSYFVLLLLSSTTALGACASTGHINSLDDLTAHVDAQGFQNLPQQRLLSLSGLLPNGSVGSAYRYDNDRSPFTAIGISANGKSYLRVRYVEYAPGDSSDKLASLLELRDKLTEVRALAAKAIRAQVEQTIYARTAVTADDAAKLGELEAEVTNTRTSFEASWQEAIGMVNLPGLIVIRTNTKRTISLGARIGSVLGLSSAEDEESAGFAILAGLEMSTLYLGTDLDDWANPLSEDWTLVGSRFPYLLGSQFPFIGQFTHYDVRILTAKLAAEHVLYASDQLTERQIQVDLKATVEQLSSAGDWLAAGDELAIEGILTSVESLGNLGVLGPVREEIVPLPVACDAPVPRREFRTVYEVLTDYDDLQRMSDRWPRLHLTRWF